MSTDETAPAPIGLLVLMGVVLVWSLLLTAGFGYAALASDGFGRGLVYGVIAVFTGLLAARTGYELVRKVAQRAR